ncbi:hypothetical protein [Thermococcus sp.]|uniref:hypothetical protein n=1 Tax=Thermococcus sp. TaxID=35749 RepID=UPI0026222CC8|nr:hypothetical protein [Thermococcus sp.]
MRRFLALGVLILIVFSSASVSAKIEPYVYSPTVPDISFAVLAFYRTGDYARVLEGCEWLLQLRTPFDSWGYAYGEEHEAKYTAMAMLALMRGENIAHGRYLGVLNNAAYWLIYKQKPDGSWEDYTGTALALLALREFRRGYVNKSLSGFGKQVDEAIARATGWLMGTKPKNDMERIFGYLALGKREELEKMKVGGELMAYRAFALAYLGEKVELSGNFTSNVAIAMALYATGNENYREELLRREHFGFWGKLHYRVLDLLSVSKVKGFEDLRDIACPYLGKIRPGNDWEKVVLADYYLTCGERPELPGNISSLLPWQVAEIARIKALLGENYSGEVNYLLSRGKNGVWRDFYNTEYVIWVFRGLNVSYNYSQSIEYLSKNLTWMFEKDPRTGNPRYYNVPSYYFAYAVIVFKEFGMERELNETLEILRGRQYENGAFPYTQGSVAGITSTAKVAWALQEANLTGTELYKKAVSYLRKLLYADIPEPQEDEGFAVLKNATFVIVKGSSYAGNSTDRVKLGGIDGYVVIYPSRNPLAIEAYPVAGFRALPPKEGGEKGYLYIGIAVIAIALTLAIVLKVRKPGK